MKDLIIAILIGVITIIASAFMVVCGVIAACVLVVIDIFFKSLPFVVAGIALLAIWHFLVQPLV